MASASASLAVAVIGGGINGLCVAWELATAGHRVTLFERDTLCAHTSSASSKLLHGGLRYLEHGEFRLVRESLRERQAWLDRAPNLTRPLQITLPIYAWSRRGRRLVGLGLWLYHRLARASTLPTHIWLDRASTVAQHPDLKPEGLLGSYRFWDAQMDDRQLGLWVADQARQAGVAIQEHTAVAALATDGTLHLGDGQLRRFERIVNVAGPWAEHLLYASQIRTRYRLDLVRGSHIVLGRALQGAYLLEAPDDRRVFFTLPWQGATLVGTTEVREQYPSGTAPRPPQPSAEEIDYLLRAYNRCFATSARSEDIRQCFSGLRPLICSAQDPNRATREYVLERRGRLTTVFGGKWTTACSLARKVRQTVETVG